MSFYSNSQTTIPLVGFKGTINTFPTVSNDTILATINLLDLSNQYNGNNLVGRDSLVLWKNCKRYRIVEIVAAFATSVTVKILKAGNPNLTTGVCAFIEETKVNLSFPPAGITEGETQCINAYYTGNDIVEIESLLGCDSLYEVIYAENEDPFFPINVPCGSFGLGFEDWTGCMVLSFYDGNDWRELNRNCVDSLRLVVSPAPGVVGYTLSNNTNSVEFSDFNTEYTYEDFNQGFKVFNNVSGVPGAPPVYVYDPSFVDSTFVLDRISDSLALIPVRPDSIYRSGNNIILRDGEGSVSLSDLVNTADSTSVVASTGISVVESPANRFTVTNTSPDQTVSVTGGGITSVTGTYPNFTVTSTEVDGNPNNEYQNLTLLDSVNRVFRLQIAPNGNTVKFKDTNSGGTVTSIAATSGTGISVTGSPITTSGTINITNTAPDQTVSLAQGQNMFVTGTYPNFTLTAASTNLSRSLTGSIGANPAVVNTLSSTGDDVSASYAKPITVNSVSSSTYQLGIDTTSEKGVATKYDIELKQTKLVSGTNIKTVNGNSLLGSGNLSIATGVTGTGTTNKVAFWDSGTSLSNNNNFHWDNTNTRLGIGLTAPVQRLDLDGAMSFRLNSGVAPSASSWLHVGSTNALMSANGGSLIGNLTAYNATINRSTRTFVLQGPSDGVGEGISFVTGSSTAERINISNSGTVRINGLAGTGERIASLNSTGELSRTSVDPSTVLFGNGVTNRIPYYNGTTSFTNSNSLRVDNSANLIIGDATGSLTAMQKVDVSGAISLRFANSLTPSVNSVLHLGNTSNLSSGSTGSVVASQAGYIAGNNRGSNTLLLQGPSSGTSGISFVTGSTPTEKMHIANTGDVYISNLGTGFVGVTSGVLSTFTTGTGLSLSGGVLTNTVAGLSGLTANTFPIATSGTTIGNSVYTYNPSLPAFVIPTGNALHLVGTSSIIDKNNSYGAGGEIFTKAVSGGGTDWRSPSDLGLLTAELDGNPINEGRIGIASTGGTNVQMTSNTSGQNPITYTSDFINIDIEPTTSSNGGTLDIKSYTPFATYRGGTGAQTTTSSFNWNIQANVTNTHASLFINTNSVANDEVVIGTSGTYRVDFQVPIKQDQNGDNWLCELQKADTGGTYTVIGGTESSLFVPYSTGAHEPMTISAVVFINANEKIRVRFTQLGSGTLSYKRGGLTISRIGN